MKNLSIGFALGTALLLGGCATTPHKPLTFDQLGQFSSYALNAQTYRISTRLVTISVMGLQKKLPWLKQHRPQ